MRTAFPMSATLLLAVLFPAGIDARPPATSGDPPPVSAWMQNAMSSGVFLEYHPDVRGQQKGIGYYRQRRFEMARQYFELGARYSDKASQAMLAQMHWRGEGAARDRAKAYVWMDLAAERGYPVFLAEREKMWSALNDAERERAASIGQSLYAEYGDDAARPRLERKMRIGRFRTVTGSRTGYDGGVRTLSPNADGSYSRGMKGLITGHGSLRAAHLDERLWHPELYWQVQDRIWRRMPAGEVIVHPLEQASRGD